MWDFCRLSPPNPALAAVPAPNIRGARRCDSRPSSIDDDHNDTLGSKYNSNEPKQEWLIEKSVLDAFCEAGKKFVGSFYRGNPQVDKTKEIILPYTSKIIERSFCSKAKKRHLDQSYNEIQKFGLYIPRILDERKPFDTIITILSGGYEPSFLCMDIMEQNELLSISRDADAIMISHDISKEVINSNIKDKKILLIDDVIQLSTSIIRSLDFCFRNNAREVYTAVVKMLYLTEKTLEDAEIIHPKNFMEYLESTDSEKWEYHNPGIFRATKGKY